MQSGHDLTTATESVAALKSALSSSETFSKHYLVCCNVLSYSFNYCDINENCYCLGFS